MVRISRLSDYAIQLLAVFARVPGHGFNAKDLSGSTGTPEPTVRKLLKILSRAQLLDSRRGARGGYRLARPPEVITLAEIIAAIEGPLGLTECTEPDGKCDLQDRCAIRGNWQRINQAIQGALAAVTLSQMVESLPATWPLSVPASGGTLP